jgi:hypothetical protein
MASGSDDWRRQSIAAASHLAGEAGRAISIPMRYMIAALALVAASSSLPAQAWEAGVEGPLCTLEHSGPAGEVRLTYDPSLPLYTIAIRGTEPWPEFPVFAIRFDGPRENTISTARHVLSEGGLTLSVADVGFGNVLDGLEFNAVAVAYSGTTSLAFDLAGAAPEVAEFRACTVAPSA